MSINAKQLFEGFSKLNYQERLARLMKLGTLTPEDVKQLNAGQPLSIHLAENFIENVIGYFQLPLGVATNFRIDNQDYVIPMAVEETSIIAAVSKTARWVREFGELTTESIGNESIGQIQLAKVKNFDKLHQLIELNKHFLMDLANKEVAASLLLRGGGIRDLTIRRLPRDDGDTMAIIHVYVDTCDAMGANIINQICEFLKTPIQNITDEKVTMCILSNLNDRKITRAKVVIYNIEPELGEQLEEASRFAECDPYRAATNNKGILNGIDPILIATGNDWRAVEAGIHAYACRDGQYRSLSQWRMEKQNLVGYLEAPISVGTVGGVTRLHPTALMCLKMLGVENAQHLARIIAAVGLIQNLGALRALVTVGIIEGHMRLHIANLTLSAGAKETEIPIVQRRLEEILKIRKRITLSNAIEVLKELRRELSKSIKESSN